MAIIQSGIPGEQQASQAPPAQLSAEEFRDKALRIEHEISKVIVGQRTLLHQVLVCLLAGGNALLEGVPGLAKPF